MLRQPDTPLPPKMVTRLTTVCTLAATIGLLISIGPSDKHGRDHVFSGIYRGLGKWFTFEKHGLRIGAPQEEPKA